VTKEKAWVTKNMILGFEFDKYLIEHPAFAKRIPNGSTVFLLPESDKELCRRNRALAEKERLHGKKIALVKIKNLSPLPKSRIHQPVLATIAA